VLDRDAKTECRNVITFRTVFGEDPRASIARASRSMSYARRFSRAGEVWTRCMDAQF
jgi:hypothetical protein